MEPGRTSRYDPLVQSRASVFDAGPALKLRIAPGGKWSLLIRYLKLIERRFAAIRVSFWCSRRRVMSEKTMTCHMI